MITFGNNVFKVNNTDINSHYNGTCTKPYIYNDDTVIQSLTLALFLNKDDIYFGDGNELNLLDNVFNMVSDIGESFSLIKIKEKIESADPRIKVDIQKSKVTLLSDEVILNLSVAIQGQKGNKIITKRFFAI